MGDTFHACHFHIVFSTKNRVPLLRVGLRERVWEYMAGVVRHKGANPILVGGHIDHVHMLVAIPPRLAPASIVQQVKGGTTHWVHESIGGLEGFAWQQGYGIFTIGISGLEGTKAYIQGQDEHHRTKSFENEYKAFLRAHMLEFDDEDVLG